MHDTISKSKIPMVYNDEGDVDCGCYEFHLA